jgi:type 1 fimbria pilin
MLNKIHITQFAAIGALIGSMLGAGDCVAACIMRGGVENTTVMYSVPESISIPSNASNGTIVYTLTAGSAPRSDFKCGNDARGIQSTRGDIPVNGIIPLGSTGLGYTLSSAGGKDPSYPFIKPSNNGFVRDPFVIDIYKIGDVSGREKILGGAFAKYLADTLTLYTAYFSNDIAISVNGCELRVPDVQMGDYVVSEFRGVGQAAKSIDFAVELFNCSEGVSKAIFSMGPVHGWADHANGVMNLSPGGAKGLGVQIKKDGKPVRFGFGGDLGSPRLDGGVYNFTAAYYQLDSKVGSGEANSAVNINISYL